jgi:hypothetical protein
MSALRGLHEIFGIDPVRAVPDHQRMSQRSLITAAVALTLSITAPAKDGVKISELPDRLRVEVNGQFFTEYCFTGKTHPTVNREKDGSIATNWPTHVYFYPVLGPGGTPLTRNWPMRDVEGEAHDHKHHRSLWYSHGSVNGIDFWAEEPRSGKIVHDHFLETKSGPASGVIRSANNWIAPDGKVVLTDERTFRVFARPSTERLFDFDITLKAPERTQVVLGDTKEGSMAIRINEQMRLTREKNQPGTGHIVQSTGLRDDKTWGARADWCDYFGPIDGKVVGIAIFDHPSNPRHPTWWHVRDYGLFAANPFGVHDFEKKPVGAGNLTIPAGGSITFKYRFYFHEGDEQQAKVAERYQEYVRQVK